MNTTCEDIIVEQLQFYRSLGTGCVFSAVAAKDPAKHGWRHYCVNSHRDDIGTVIKNACADEASSTISLLFPNVKTTEQLVSLIYELKHTESVTLELNVEYDRYKCLGFRVHLTNDIKSWVSGFGPFPFLPATRQAPYTEIVFRSKPRPNYAFVMKSAPPDVVHLADMQMYIQKKRVFKKYWNRSIKEVRRRLGQPPDLRSAAKTTFAIPADLIE